MDVIGKDNISTDGSENMDFTFESVSAKELLKDKSESVITIKIQDKTETFPSIKSSSKDSYKDFYKSKYDLKDNEFIYGEYNCEENVLLASKSRRSSFNGLQ